MSRGELSQAEPLIERLKAWGPESDEFINLFSRFIYLDPVLSPDRKLKLLEGLNSANPWRNYYLGAVFGAMA